MTLKRLSAGGVGSSTVHLPPGDWATLLDGLCARFPSVSRETWLQRMAAGRVLDGAGAALGPDHPYRAGLRVHYFREVPDEARIPFAERILHLDEHLLVADKPHFLPVLPSGSYVEETLLSRLARQLDNPHLVPLHRIDRLTAGLVLFSVEPRSRGRYQALFRERRIAKRYEAIAPALPALEFPLCRRSRLVEGEPFFRMQEGSGTPNSETHIEVLERRGALWRYGLDPVTGKRHQLRVHMAALGAPLCNDPLYPALDTARHRHEDYARPLKLLARSLRFEDPLSGAERCFHSALTLDFPALDVPSLE